MKTIMTENSWKKITRKSVTAMVLVAMLSSCSAIDKWKKEDFDYYLAHPVPTKDQMVKPGTPDSRASDSTARTQQVLDKMAQYDQPLTNPMPRGEGGLISEFKLQSSSKMVGAESKKIISNAEDSPEINPVESVPVKKPTKPKAAAKDSNVDPNALALRDMLENPGATSDAAVKSTDGSATEVIDPTQPREVQINFNNTSLRAVIEMTFGEYIKKPYVIASDFADKEVNWVAQGEYTTSEIKRMFETFLEIQGVNIALVDGIFTIGNKGSTQKIPGSGDVGVSAGVWRLKNIDATEAMQIIRPFIANPEGITMMDKRNTIIVTGSGPEIRYVDAFLKSLDVSNFKDKRIMVYAPKFISAEALTTLIQALPMQLSMNTNEGRKQIEAAVVTGAKRVVIVADSQETRDVVMQYINQVDAPGKKQKQVFYYALRNQSVDDVRTTLTNLLPGMLPDTAEITVASNAPTNSVMITATADQYFEIKKVIDRLDYRVPSVLIDATIVEVQLNDNLAYGVEWFLGGRVGSVKGDVTTKLKNSAAITTPAARIGVISLSDNTFATLDLLASETSLRVLSRPRVMVKNKATATIKSTDQVRLIKSVLTTAVQQGGDNIPKREFEDKEVGVSLQVTPRIAEDGTISMAVKIQDSRQGADDDASGERPRFNLREVNTELVTSNGETILIGGLIRNTVSRVKNKVPFFGDVPFFGQAFSNTNDTDQRTELVIFMTPYLVVDQVSARLVSEALSGLAHINPEILAKNTTTPDPDLTTPVSEREQKKPDAAAHEGKTKTGEKAEGAMIPPPQPKPESMFEESGEANKPAMEKPPVEKSAVAEKPANKPMSPDAVPNIPPPPNPPFSAGNNAPAGNPIKSEPSRVPPPTLAPDDSPSPVPDSGKPNRGIGKGLLQ